MSAISTPGAISLITALQTATYSSASPKSERKVIWRKGYLPCCRRCQRVRFNIFLCFFFRIFFLRFFTTDDKSSPSPKNFGLSGLAAEDLLCFEPADGLTFQGQPDRSEPEASSTGAY